MPASRLAPASPYAALLDATPPPPHRAPMLLDLVAEPESDQRYLLLAVGAAGVLVLWFVFRRRKQNDAPK